EGRGGHLVQVGLESVAAKTGRVPRHDHRPGHQAPTSAWMAPGPSAVLPWPSDSAPTRIEILPRCLFSSISWWASATPSKPSVRHRTGRIWPLSISSFAFVHSYALAKCDPRISFWRIHRYATLKSRSRPVVPAQMTTLPNDLTVNTDVGKVALPTCSKTMSGASPSTSLTRLANARETPKRAFSSSALSPPLRIMPSNS